MKITLLSEDAIRLEPVPGMMTIEAPSAEHSFSPFQMFAGGLAICTWSILASWGSNAGIAADDLVIEVRWTFAEEPHRIGALEVRFHWPALPAQRRAAAKRVAALCPIHQTLHHPPDVAIVDSAEPAPPLAVAGVT